MGERNSADITGIMKFVTATVADIGTYGNFTRAEPADMPRRVAAHLAREIQAQVSASSGNPLSNSSSGQRTDANPNGAAIDLALLFLSTQCVPYAEQLVAELRRVLNINLLIGCSAENVISPEAESDNEAAIVLLAAQLPQVTVTPFYLRVNSVESWNHMMDNAEAFQAALGMKPGPADPPKLFVLLADPFSSPVESLLEAFNEYCAGVPVVGGLASSGQLAGENVFILNEQVSNVGIVGFALSGAVDVDVVVSQGCRPIGPTYKVTAASDDLIFSLNGGSPLKQVQAMVDDLNEAERELLQNGLFIGRAVRKPEPNREDNLGRGDFLIRAVMGVDQTTGALSVSDKLKESELVQFHVRDAKTAEEDLALMLAPQAFSDAPAGALLFSCNGRGLRLFDHPDADIGVVQAALSEDQPVPAVGFFCAGEFGPIGDRNFLHSHTASLVLFRPAPSTDGFDTDADESGDASQPGAEF